MQVENPAAAVGDAHAVGDLMTSDPDDFGAVKQEGPAAAQRARHLAVGKICGQRFTMPA